MEIVVNIILGSLMVILAVMAATWFVSAMLPTRAQQAISDAFSDWVECKLRR